ncbi:hypothetical protein FOE78_21265 [Microlunatus elymi]|uniref:Ribbon-helix-helix domain-containing protein n=1 Tax=Microlunatus elymi TaxID=2596828 RepID=A0A516Q4F0_9ACTN|nr:hypothetical protein [Microlunatus elymi]QDP98091.1 hypothetical protein FOE78_21265 [Microlunatus elymi]
MSHRTQITLADEQYERLLTESSRSGLGLAELVRRAIDQTYGCNDVAKVLQALDLSYASWSEEGDRGEVYVESLRQGMARRLEATR